MFIRVRDGKGRRERHAKLSPMLLNVPRAYYRVRRPEDWLFPGPSLANLESLSVKRQRMLPARCRVYDLLNFASEIATHRASSESRPRLQAYIGTLVSDEFDLEGTAEKVPELKDLFLNLN
jgi:hypothetical protein